MVTKKTSQTLDVNELVGKPTPAAASTPAAEENAPAPVEPTAPAAPAPVHHMPVRPHRIHIGGERAGDNTMPSANQNYTNQYPQQQNNTPTEEVKGFLDSQPEGHGFLRPKFIHSSRDIYISQSQIRRFMLRAGAVSYTHLTLPTKRTV